jgi:hypothetical protein
VVERNRQELTQNPTLKDRMKEQLEDWRTKALRYEDEALAPESSFAPQS